MKVKVKELKIDMLLKTNGMELEVRTPDDKTQIGDCYVTSTGLQWCTGRTTKKNGIRISWNELAEILKSDASKSTALNAAKALS